MTDKKYNFFESYHRALSHVPDESYGRVVKAMSRYVFEGIEPHLKEPMDLVAWELIKPILEKGCELSLIRSLAGKSGGQKGKGVSRNVGNDFAALANQRQNNSKTKANQKQIKSGIGIGEGIGNKESETKKERLSSSSHSLDERKEWFMNSINPFVEKYGKDMCNDFFETWTETNDKGLMRFELEKTWETSKRLSKWKKNERR